MAEEWRVEVKFVGGGPPVTFYPVMHRSYDPKASVMATLRQVDIQWADAVLERIADAVLALLPPR